MTISKVVCLTLLILCCLGTSPAYANNQNKAKAYYFSAEDSFNEKNYDDAIKSLKKVEGLLGNSNSTVSALKIKILFAQGKLNAAKEELNNFYSYDATTELSRDMSRYLTKIDKGIEKKIKQDKAARRAMKLAAERKRKEAIANKQAVKSKSVQLINLINSQRIGKDDSVIIQKPRASFSTGYKKVYDDVELWASYQFKQVASYENGYCTLKTSKTSSFETDKLVHDGDDWGKTKISAKPTFRKYKNKIIRSEIKKLATKSIGTYSTGMKRGKTWVVKDRLYYLGGSFGAFGVAHFSNQRDANKALELVKFVAKWGQCK